jgi:hypothetical protein
MEDKNEANELFTKLQNIEDHYEDINLEESKDSLYDLSFDQLKETISSFKKKIESSRT